MFSLSIGAKKLARLFVGFFIAIFLVAMFASLFYLSGGMETMSKTSGCPFASHGTVVCEMNIRDHLGAWQAFFTAVPQTIFMILSVLALAVLFVSCSVLFKQFTQVWELSHFSKRTKERYDHIVLILTELFSNGILHPKLF